jgi:hypothetical protein
MSEYVSQIQNQLFVESDGKYFVPSIITQSFHERLSLMVVRNCDLIRNYNLRHIKH